MGGVRACPAQDKVGAPVEVQGRQGAAGWGGDLHQPPVREGLPEERLPASPSVLKADVLHRISLFLFCYFPYILGGLESDRGSHQ